MKLYQCAFVFLMVFSPLLKAEIAVIVHPSVDISSLTQDNVQRIFLGKATRFANGQPAKPINQDAGNAIRDEFISKVLDKSQGQYRSYWSRLIFTGKGRPPQDEGGDDDIKKLVASNPDAIGYIDTTSVDDSVKVVYTTN